MASPQSSRAAIRDRILAAARELFRADGVRAVTMGAVARRAECSRQLVYKVFFDRRELVLAAAVERITEIADDAAGAAPSTSFRHAFVDLSVEIIETLRNDPELNAILGEGSPVTLHDALWERELVDRAGRFWRPWLDHGRTQGMLRTDLDNSDLADWLHTVYASIILRRNIPANDERSMIERFVLTSLTMATTDTAAG
ncbi:helix-turn-helix domain-containing protein [[Mycobacterium] wendilense]|uniref:Helix-turn-helix domain-containing protein n=1 Tax=[Mycobacterium] wendilense TaxID=3064284 RepID=A0ABN9P0W9_9MYCO|nr:helix-turn-helix domain-containing protein [Mycolicibacterium sp. MU0050]CAJ1584585.1 helix-turn-helix domain-containing protein [Mycolicibacterium sp. MU0050]